MKKLNSSITSPRLSDLEAEVMSVVWEKGEATVQDVKEALEPRRSLAYTTIMTILGRLVKKGVLERHKEGKAYLYCPVTSREHLAGSMLRSLVRRLYDGATGRAIAHLLESDENVIEYVPLRPPLFYASLLKSTLVMLGISSAVFQLLTVRPVPIRQVLPVFILWAVLVWLVQFVLARQNRGKILSHTFSVDPAVPRLNLILDRVLNAYRRLGCARISRGSVCCEAGDDRPIPKLLLSASVKSPLITLSGGDPFIRTGFSISGL